MQIFDSPADLRRTSEIPLYRQIERFIRQQIESGRFAPGEMLPSVKVLCEEFGGLNHLTVRAAIRSLIEEGIVESRRGRGTFVTVQRTRAGRIALVVPGLDDILSTRISKGVQQVLTDSRIRTIVMDSRQNPEEELDNIRQLGALPLDGAIILPVKVGDIFEEIYRLKIDRFPFVLIDRYFYDIDVPSVVVDNYKGTFDLTSHLVAGGRKRIAWIGSSAFSSAADRFRGYCDALNENGLTYQQRYIRNDVDEKVATHSLLAERPRPDAIVFLNDVSALAGMHVIKEAGLRIPEDIAVGGFDDIPEASSCEPLLTTVSQPMERLGSEAAQLLLKSLRVPGLRPQKIVLPVETVARNST